MANKPVETTSKDLSEFRTEWARERTLLATERTFMAWLRTGLAITAGGAIVVRLLSGVEPGWLVDVLAIVLVLVGLSIVLLSVWGYQRVLGSYPDTSASIIPAWIVWGLVLALEAAFIGIFLIFLISN